MRISNLKIEPKSSKSRKKQIMKNSRYNAHTNSIFKQYRILPFDFLIQGQLLFMPAIGYINAPKSYATTWTKNKDRDPK
jgi:hypothetical protein